MIIWINGAFGSGKSSAAFELHRRLTGSFVFDPEQAGYYIRRNTPKPTHAGDFQDEPLWRRINADMLRLISSGFDGVIIAPMTITSPQYYDEIIGALRRAGIPVFHCVLSAGSKTLAKRLRSRMDGARSWGMRHITPCIEAFKNPIFENHIITDDMQIYQVADAIAAGAGVTLLPPARGRLRRFIQNKLTSLRQNR